MIVQPVVLGQLTRPGIEAVDPRPSLDRRTIVPRQPAICLDRRQRRVALGKVSIPDRRPLLQPAAEIAAPQHLADELLGPVRSMLVQCPRQHLLLLDQPMPQIRRQRRHVRRPLARAPMIVVPLGGIAAAHGGGEGAQPGKAGGAGGFVAHSGELGRRRPAPNPAFGRAAAIASAGAGGHMRPFPPQATKARANVCDVQDHAP